ncbi:hypothetical protein B484DRAFT_408491 [Ochromonadaceae sp. CCMP2298]|nr:hypothetical protein B484DRAFT_408491 [Ochromonadaceae sp. CCMP2298]
MTLVFVAYRQSGNQDGEIMYDLWPSYAQNPAFNGGDVATYSAVLFTSNEYNLLGKQIPEKAGRDTGAIDPNNTYEDRLSQFAAEKETSAEARKRQRLAQKERGGSDVMSEISSPGIGLADVIGQRMATQNKISALEAILKWGSEEAKEDALKRLQDIVG